MKSMTFSEYVKYLGEYLEAFPERGELVMLVEEERTFEEVVSVSICPGCRNGTPLGDETHVYLVNANRRWE